MEYTGINRQPTLHEYGMFAMHIRLNDESPIDPGTGITKTGNIYNIGLPLPVCGPLGGDFDGDQLSVHLVPESAKDDTLAKMSPKYVNIYKKNNEPIFAPNHETLNGLAVMSEVKCKDLKELEEPKFYYTSWADLVRDVEVDQKLDLNRPIVFTGKIGSETYKNKITTYGRLKLSKIIDRDIDKIRIFKNEYPECLHERITAGAGAKLYQFLYKDDNGTEEIKNLQVAALRAVTEAGVVTFDFKTLYSDTDTETYKKLRAIADSDKYTDKQKTLLLTEEYKKYSKEVEKTYSEDLKNELSRAARVKLQSIMDINMPQFIISGVEERPIINKGSLLGGLSEKEYQVHAIENRALLSIKQSGTPTSGLVILTSINYMNRWKVLI